MTLSRVPSMDEINGATSGCSIMRPPATSNAFANYLTIGRHCGIIMEMNSLMSVLHERHDSQDGVMSAHGQKHAAPAQ